MEAHSLIFTRRNAFIAVVALILLLVSSLIKHPFIISTSDVAYILNWDFIASILTELAFALIIALGISIGIEHQTRKVDLESADKLRKLIAEDVFRGVFANDLPKSYIDSVIEQNLRVGLIRPFVRIYERISYASGDEGSRPLKCTRRVSFIIKNVSDAGYLGEFETYIPVDIDTRLEDTGISYLKVGSKELSQAEVLLLRRINTHDERVEYHVPFSAHPGEEVAVEMEIELYKELTDSEIWSTVYPTLKLSYSIRFDVPVTRFGVVARSSSKLTQVFKDEHSGYGDWEIDGPLLPHNSLAIWWDCREEK